MNDPNKIKTIRIEYLVNGLKFDVNVKNKDTIGKLKSEIVNRLGGGITLVKLMIKPPLGRNSKPIPEDDNLTIFDAKIKSDSTIIIGRDNVVGGKEI